MSENRLSRRRLVCALLAYGLGRGPQDAGAQAPDIVELAARHRLPALYEVDGFVDAGELLSYGPSLPGMYRRAAGFVDRILKGARPADLPVEEPTRFDVVLNLKAAKRIGLTIPTGVLVRADRIIE